MPLSIGESAPDFALPGVDDRTWSLSDFAGKPALAVIFSCNHCPYVIAWESRLVGLHDRFADRGFRIVAINSNEDSNYPQDSFENMKVRARERGFPFPYLRDDDQSVATAFGAERTPHVFLFDSERKLRYIGAVDDNYKDPAGVSETWLADAIEALLDGGPVPQAETQAVGCSIKWRQGSGGA